jgi:hypothetical protein
VMDMLGDGAAPLGPMLVRVSFTAYDADPETVDATIDEMLLKIHSYGRGWLYTKGAESGVEVIRKTRARAVNMPTQRWQAGDVVNKSASVTFRCDPYWYGATGITATTVTATGTLTVAVQPTIGDTFTIGGIEYTFVAEVDADAEGEVGIGANLAGAKTNIVAAINGTDGWNTANALATAATFSGDTCLITADNTGHQGNGVVFTETFDDVANVMNGDGYLGGTTAGVGGVHSAVRSFSLNNTGNAPIYRIKMVLAGTVSNPVIRNTTTGYEVAMDRADSATYTFDASGPAVLRNGVNDYSNFIRQAGQIQLMKLAPGVNNFTVSGITSGTITITNDEPAFF